MMKLTKLVERKFAIMNVMMPTPFVQKCSFCVESGRGGKFWCM